MGMWDVGMSTDMAQPVGASESVDDETNVIEIRQARKEYPGDIVAVDDVDLDIREGEFFTLLGPSGSGKSTLLQLITGIERPTSGTVSLRGEVVNDVKPYNRNTSLVFQEYALFPHMTARENVAYGLMLRGIDEDERNRRVQAMFELMDLQGKEDRPIGDLSGGERQRVATARSLVIEPDVLLLDEVLGPLDEKLAKEMQVELKRIQEEVERTFVFVTHSQEEAFTMSDRIAIMDDGEVVQVGEPLEIYHNPRTAFVADFLGMPNVLTGEVVAVDGDRLTVDSDGQRFEVSTGAVDDPSVGDPATFFIPNEQVVFTEDRDNTVSATVADTIFKGSYTEYALELESGGELRCHHTTGDTLVEEGTSVTVGFDATAAKLLE